MSYGWLIAAVLAAGIYGGVLYVRGRMQKVARSMFGVDSITEGLELQADRLAETPKSVSGMTKLCLPQIEADFPQFSLPEFRQKAENMLVSAFHAIAEKNASCLINASAALRDQVKLEIDGLSQRGATAVYERVRVHRTEITQYKKSGGSCIITLQSALEYLYYTNEGDGRVKGDAERLTQTKYNTELVYIQDAQLVSGLAADKSIGLTCQNCGAPVKSLGQKTCDYCGSGIVEINLHAWVLNRFYEVVGSQTSRI